jgi:hypothetical protein
VIPCDKLAVSPTSRITCGRIATVWFIRQLDRAAFR